MIDESGFDLVARGEIGEVAGAEFLEAVFGFSTEDDGLGIEAVGEGIEGGFGFSFGGFGPAGFGSVGTGGLSFAF